MKLCFFIDWCGEEVRSGPDNSTFYINTYCPDADWVIDMSSRICSDLASKYPPNKRIYAAVEPSAYMDFNPFKIVKMGDFYKGAIFSWHKELKHFPQTIRFRMGASWVTWETSSQNKTFGVSGIFSGKKDSRLKGYEVRKNLIALDGKIKIPSMIYHPGGAWNGTTYSYPRPSKKESLDFMFHLAVENCQEEGYFSEKIMDCFMSYSIPLYYGDPKIYDTFNPEGIIILDIENPLDQINSLTPELYASKIDAMESNRELSFPYRGLESNVYYHIKNHLGDKNARNS